MGHQFGNRLRQLRSEWGLLQRELEELMALRPGSVSQYERGLREPGFDLLIAIADELEVSLDFLLGRPYAVKDGPGLVEGRRRLKAALEQAELPPRADERLALLLTQAGKVEPGRFGPAKLARLVMVTEKTLKNARDGKGGLTAAGRNKLAHHFDIPVEWIDDSVRNQ